MYHTPYIPYTDKEFNTLYSTVTVILSTAEYNNAVAVLKTSE